MIMEKTVMLQQRKRLEACPWLSQKFPENRHGCARRIERVAADWMTVWMVPPVKRPCEMRIERETT